ncbi:MAG: CBS domain-containing protein [Chitinophagales bacterium]|nr:CBS domain-containing protein [Chitinophagales bacterium]
MNESVTTIMIKDLTTLHPDDKVGRAAEIFKSKRIHHLPIVEGGDLVGLITTHDLWNRHIPPSDFEKIDIKDIMSKKLIKLTPEDKIGTAAELFLDNRFHALPVVDGSKIVGLITTFDVLRYMFKKEYPNPILFKDELDGDMDSLNR